jgi:hypothetical protein
LNRHRAALNGMREQCMRRERAKENGGPKPAVAERVGLKPDLKVST